MSHKRKNKDWLVRGSIRAEARHDFLENYDKQKITIEDDGIEATIITACLTGDLKAILDKHGIFWKEIKETGERFNKPYLVEQGLPFDDINKADEGYIRLKFGDMTADGFEEKKHAIQDWLDSKGIWYGEKDGGDCCMFVCPTKKQETITKEYLQKLEETEESR